MQQYFLPPERRPPEDASYSPLLYASASIGFSDRRLNVDETRDVAVVVPLQEGAVTVDWDRAEETTVAPGDLETTPEEGVPFEELPAAASKKTSYTKWEREFKRWVARTQTLTLLECKELKMVSRPGDSERNFRIQLRDRAHELRDEAATKIRKKYASKIQTLSERIRRAQQAVERETEQAGQQKLQTALSFGVAVLSSMIGRKATNRSTLGRATTAARGLGRSMKEKEDIARAAATVNALSQQLADLEAELAEELERISTNLDPLAVQLDSVEIRSSQRRVAVQTATLCWSCG